MQSGPRAIYTVFLCTIYRNVLYSISMSVCMHYAVFLCIIYIYRHVLCGFSMYDIFLYTKRYYTLYTIRYSHLLYCISEHNTKSLCTRHTYALYRIPIYCTYLAGLLTRANPINIHYMDFHIHIDKYISITSRRAYLPNR